MVGTRCSWTRAQHHIPHHPEAAKEQMRPRHPFHGQQNAALDPKTSLGERQEGFSSPILTLCSQVGSRDDQSPKAEPRPAVFSSWLPPPPRHVVVTFSSSRKLAAKLLESGR